MIEFETPPREKERRVDLRKVNRVNDIHQIPDFEGEREHDVSAFCWCKPLITLACAIEDKRIWTHFRDKK